ncbi:hypothetical protein LCGC14_2008320 [marine sediment metagenome]|uniref:Uncharacterized protein n=1 Tax=marine sediment metagenome TaxID=412755 RepID=A0A0F9F179_9ZZZZ
MSEKRAKEERKKKAGMIHLYVFDAYEDDPAATEPLFQCTAYIHLREGLKFSPRIGGLPLGDEPRDLRAALELEDAFDELLDEEVSGDTTTLRMKFEGGYMALSMDADKRMREAWSRKVQGQPAGIRPLLGHTPRIVRQVEDFLATVEHFSPDEFVEWKNAWDRDRKTVRLSEFVEEVEGAAPPGDETEPPPAE